MTRGQYFSRVMPLAAVAYAIVLILTGASGTVAVVGALFLAAIAVAGTSFIRPDPGSGRQRNRNRNRTR